MAAIGIMDQQGSGGKYATVKTKRKWKARGERRVQEQQEK